MSIAEVESLIIFIFVFGGVAFRNLLRLKQPIWLFFLVGALATVALGVLTPKEAYESIDLQVMVFLFSMFVIASALKISGLLGQVGALITKSSKGWLSLVLFFLIFSVASAFLMNDPLAIIGTPVALYLSGNSGSEEFPFLLALAFAVTTGSEMTPMGNPQNLLVAVESGMRAPIIIMTQWLLLPTLVNLALAIVVLRVAYLRSSKVASDPVPALQSSGDARFRVVTIAGVAVTVVGIFLINWLQLMGFNPSLDISGVALLGSAIVLGLGGRERELLYDVDWGVLVMFAGLFVVTQGMWDSGLVASIASVIPPPKPNGNLALIILPSIILSQVISNVPMVALYMPLMKQAGFGPSSFRAWAALAAGSTLAGNLTLMGAASNLIIVQEEDRQRGKSSMDFWRFAAYGFPLTVLNCVVLYAFLSLGIKI
ncbi:MAG: SLC13 family permease [Thermoprotei archaeon]